MRSCLGMSERELGSTEGNGKTWGTGQSEIYNELSAVTKILLSMKYDERFERLDKCCQASKTAFRSRCARPGGTLHTCVSEAFCPNIQPRAHARLTGLTKTSVTPNVGGSHPITSASRALVGAREAITALDFSEIYCKLPCAISLAPRKITKNLGITATTS